MQAVKLRPEEFMGGPVRSDWLLLWRLLPRGLPSNGDAGGRRGGCKDSGDPQHTVAHIKKAAQRFTAEINNTFRI